MWSHFSLTTDLYQQQYVISCWVVNVNDTPNYSIKKIPTLLDFSGLDGTVCYTVAATWECLEHSACVTESLVELPCLKLSLILHTKVYVKSDWSIKTYIKADHNTITQFGVKVMSKYKVLSKHEHGMIKCRFIKFMVANLVEKNRYVAYGANLCFRNAMSSSGRNINKIMSECKFDYRLF